MDEVLSVNDVGSSGSNGEMLGVGIKGLKGHTASTWVITDTTATSTTSTTEADTTITPQASSRRYRLHTFTMYKPDAMALASTPTTATTTTLVLAFPLDDHPVGIDNMDGNEDQSRHDETVFAWLPVVKAGLRFSLQADWDLTTSRQSLQEESGWNAWLLQAIPFLFLRAVEGDQVHLRGKIERYLPRMGEVMREAIWTHLARAILKVVKVSANLEREGC